MRASHYATCGALLGLIVLPPVPALAASYKYITIAFPYAAVVYASGLNNKGELVGSWQDGSDLQHGFLWQNGQLQTFEPPLATSGSPSDINDAGTIVGTYNSLVGGSQGYIYRSGAFTPIGHKNEFVELDAINNYGESLGYAIGVGPRNTEFTLLNGHRHVLSVSQSTYGYAINDQGTVIGTYSDRYTDYGFAYTKNGVFQRISVPGGRYTTPSAINRSGTIVGYYNNTSSYYESFIDQGGNITKVQYPGEPEAMFAGMNNVGQIVGLADDQSGTNIGFVYQNGGFQTIAVPGSALTEPTLINDKGVIAGTYVIPGGNSFAVFIAIPQ